MLESLKVDLPTEEKTQVHFPMPHVLDALSKCQESIFPDYNVYNVGNSFLLFSLDQVENGPGIMYSDSGEGDPVFEMNLKVIQVACVPVSANDALVEIANAFSKDGILFFRPGMVTIATSGAAFPINQLFVPIFEPETLLDKRIPTDVKLVIGCNKLEHHTSILTYYGLQALLDCMDPVTKQADLSEHGFTMDDLEEAIRVCTQNRFPYQHGKDLDERVKDSFVDRLNSLNDKIVALIKWNSEQSDPQDDLTPTPDCVFLVGPEEETIEANRAVLANSNPVLSRMLYGTELMTAPPESPIKWPDFLPDAVSLVFWALTQLHGSTISVPIGMEAEFRKVLDFLGETDKSVRVQYAMFAGARSEAALRFSPCWDQYHFIGESAPDLLESIEQGGEDWIVYKARTM